MTELKDKHCTPPGEGTKPYGEHAIRQHLKQVDPGWEVIENLRIRRVFPAENFREGMKFAQEIGRLAEEEDHHPDICIRYSNVEVELSTHSIGGLSENDFIMAAKIDRI